MDTTHFLYNKAQINCLFFSVREQLKIEKSQKKKKDNQPPITVYFAWGKKKANYSLNSKNYPQCALCTYVSTAWIPALILGKVKHMCKSW